jgi:hypothetical protein
MTSALELCLQEWLYYCGVRDETGAPVASGHIYFYEPGSTATAISVYSDIAGTPLAQPVALDAAGRAEVYVATKYECKVVDALGSTKRLAVRSGGASGPLTAVQFGTDMDLDTALVAIAAFMAASAVTPPVSTVHTETQSVQNPTFTIDSSKTIQYLRATYSGVSATATIANPAVAPTDYVQYTIMLHGHDGGGGATSITAVVFGSKILATALTTCLTLKTYSAEFVARNGYLVQVTPWYTSTDCNG